MNNKFIKKFFQNMQRRINILYKKWIRGFFHFIKIDDQNNWIVSFVDGTIKEKKYNDHVRAVSEFREEMYDKLPAQSSDSALSGEVKMFIFACENADVEELKDYNIEDENGNIFTCTHVTSEVFETGKANYKKFITTHKQDRRFTEGNYNIAFDPDKEQVYAGYDVACEKDGESFGCTFVCTYDKDWNLVDAYCIEGYVDSVLYKKD